MEKRRKEEHLDGWTKDQKFALLQAIKKVGTQDTEKIKDIVTCKTADEIKAALEFYKKQGSEPPTRPYKKRNRATKQPTEPLSKWVKFLIDSHGYEELQTDTVAAVRFIAKEAPPAESTEQIDFKKVYNTIADAMEGKEIICDNYVKALLDICIVKTAENCKAIAESTDLKHILQSSWNADVNSQTSSEPTEDKKLLALQHLTTQKNYNPLNIPERYLKFSLNSL